MDLAGWNERYRTEEPFFAPTPLVLKTAETLQSGKALDLAAGSGRNALWLAEQGWKITAVEGAEVALETLRRRADKKRLSLRMIRADLKREPWPLGRDAFDLVLVCYYLQRDLFEPAKEAVRPGGVFVAIVHVTESSEQADEHRLGPGELAGYFHGWDILHAYEGQPDDPAHKRPVAEIVARRPTT